jgi:hypothetical protein
MSQENVERLRTALEAYNQEGPEAIIALLDPHVEWIADRSDMGRVTYRGRDGQMTARGRSSGVVAQIPLAVVFTAGQGGKLIRYESFRDTQEALEAVGLRDA